MTQIKYDIPDYNIFKEWRPEQHFQRIDKYSNFLHDEGRLETWEEVVERTVDALRLISKDKLLDEEYQTIFDMIYKLEIMPSMRLLSMPLKAIERCNTVLYNCTYGLGDTFQSIAEAQYLSMSGCGVSWSVERKNVDKLPKIPQQSGMMYYHNVEDSQIGWAKSTETLFNAWLKGNDITFQYDRIRPYGARLKTKGGYASGPQILIDTHNFIRQTLKNAQGRKVTPLEMHDMFCYVLESGVSGGTRRCLSKDTNIITNNGLVKINEINASDYAWTPDGYKKILNVFKQGKQSITRIKLSNGAFIKATENHRLAIPTNNGYDWKLVSDLNVGDKLLFNGVEAEQGKNIEINIDPPGDFSKNYTKLEKDFIEINEEFAWVLGKFMADGSILHRTKSGVDFKRGITIATHSDEIEQRQRIEKYFIQFGINIVHKKKKKENCYTTTIVNGQIGRTFGDWKKANTSILIPHFIKESRSSVRAAFLAGLADGDGSLHNRNIVLVSTIYETLVNDVVNLYASLGIAVHIRKTIRKVWKDIYSVTIKGLSNKENLVRLLSPYTLKKFYDFKLNMYDYNYDDILLSNMQDKRLVPIEIVEIERQVEEIETFDIEVEENHCFFANGILSHNSAGMCIFDADNLEIAQCKYDGFWNDPFHKVRANANNSAVWGDDLTQKDIDELTKQLFSTGSGEPGLLKRNNAIRTSPEWRKFLHPEYTGQNPCFIEGTMVQTKNGHFPIESLIGKEVEIWNGLEWTKINNFRVTGENQPVYTVTLHDGTEITATSYHTFILEGGERKELKDLVVGDKLQISDAPLSHGNKKINGAYLKGFLMGDGTSTSDSVLLNLYEPKFMCEERLISSAEEIEPGEVKTNAIVDVSFGDANQAKNSYRKSMRGINVRRHELYRYIIREYGLPQEIFEANYESKCEFLAGLFDADGTASDTKNGFMYQYSSIHYQLLQDIQLLLKTIGINSTLRKNRESGVKDFNDNYGEYLTHDLYRLTISQISSVAFAKQVKFTRLTSFADKNVSYNLKPKWNKIVQIEENGIAEKVYCCTVSETHQFSLTNGVQVAQCGEIGLQAIPVDSEYIKGGGWQFCNLSTINARNTDTIKDLYEKTKYATLIGDIQSLATDFQFLRSGTKEICDLERLLGVNLVGYATVPLLRNNPEIMQELRDLTVEVDLKFAEEFNVNRSAAITALKPPGNSSVFCYTAPGGNPIHAVKQIRNVTVNKNSAMHTFLEAQGVPKNDYPGRDYASMFAFPIEYPEDSVTLEHCNAIDQLNIWKYLKLNWCHHNPSVSITYEQNEVEAIRQWLYENQDIIGGLAFFPKYESSYELLPIVVVNEEKYAAFTKDYPEIPWKYYHLYETAHDDRQGIAECSSGNCLIV